MAPPDYHLMVRDGRMELNRGPRENHARPAIDPLFRSAARAYRSNAAGVILSGTQGDGTVGMMAIKGYGGMTIVQDPDELVYTAMPRRAIQYVDVDEIAPVQDIPELLMEFARQRAREPGGNIAASHPDTDTCLIRESLSRQVQGQQSGQVSTYSCPECGGSLWQLDEGDAVLFRCHVGHTYSPELLLVDKSEALETALWSGVRTLVERATLTRQMADRLRQSGRLDESIALEQQAQVDDEHMMMIRDLILNATPNAGAVSDVLQEADDNRQPGTAS